MAFLPLRQVAVAPHAERAYRLWLGGLAEQLDIPLRDRNILLQAAGYAPVFPERSLDDPALQAARHAIDQVWLLMDPAVYQRLTRYRGWSPADYEQWFTGTITRLLLD